MTSFAKKNIYSDALFWSQFLEEGGKCKKYNALKNLCIAIFFQR